MEKENKKPFNSVQGKGEIIIYQSADKKVRIGEETGTATILI